MIQKEYGSYKVACDVCGEELEGKFDTFDDAKAAAYNAGWLTRRTAGEWQNICPECH